MDQGTYDSILKALQAIRTGRPEDALPFLAPTLRAHPDLAVAHHLEAIALDKLNQTDQALASMRRAVELDQGDAIAAHNLGALLLAGNAGAARSEFERALSLDPGLVQAREALERIDSGEDGRSNGAIGRPRAPEDWAPFLDDVPAIAHERGRLPLLLPPPPAQPPSPQELARRALAARAFQAPLSARRCLRIALSAVRASPGDTGAITLVFLGVAGAMFGVCWLLAVTIGFVVPGASLITAAAYALALIVLALMLAGMAHAGIMLADTKLYGTHPPHTDDLWSGCGDWGVISAVGFGKAAIALPVLFAMVIGAKLSSSAIVPIAAGLAVAPLSLWLGARLAFAVQLAVSTESGPVEAFRESWKLTRRAPGALAGLLVVNLVLAASGLAAAIALAASDMPWQAVLGGLVAAFTFTLFALPVAAAASGVAYRLCYAKEYPGTSITDD